MSNITHMPMTVGDTLQTAKDKEPDAIVVVFRERESGHWRVGWSVMELSDLCLAREYLDCCIREVVEECYRKNM